MMIKRFLFITSKMYATVGGNRSNSGNTLVTEGNTKGVTVYSNYNFLLMFWSVFQYRN